mgnify:CR=1 FL=1
MSTETDQTIPEDVDASSDRQSADHDAAAIDAGEAVTQPPATGDGNDVHVDTPDFQPLQNNAGASGKPKDLNRFQEIKVTVSADLGRASVPLQTLMDLGEGSVLELDREIGSPVDLVAQGVTLASGEVVVVNGKFAIRVTEVYEGQAG